MVFQSLLLYHEDEALQVPTKCPYAPAKQTASHLRRTWSEPFNVGLKALYKPLIPHMLSASVYRTVVNAFTVINNLNPLCPVQ